MAETKPFVLLDDARAEGASDAQLYENPREVFVARGPPLRRDKPARVRA